MMKKEEVSWQSVAQYQGFWPVKPRSMENIDYFQRLSSNNMKKIKTGNAKAVYLLLCASRIPLRFIHIRDILNMSKATAYRALKELHRSGLIKKGERHDLVRSKDGLTPIVTNGWYPKGRKGWFDEEE